ncbi:YitT family protein [Oscillospiraceae bacterium PP1C4]
MITLGVFLVAVGVYFFKFPNHFSTGGVTGLSVILGKLVNNVMPSNFVTIINILFLILGFIFIKGNFGIKTVYGSFLFSGVLELLSWAFPMSKPLTTEPLLELFFAVLLPAIGSAILFNNNSSTGGTDIIAMILRKYTSLDIGKSLLFSDILISGATLFVFDIKTGLYSLLGLVLKSVIVDSVIENINQKKSIIVNTNNPAPITEYITSKLGRSATVWLAEGAYKHEQNYMILTVMSRSESVDLRNHIKKHNLSSFILFTNTSEIFGRGFMRV